MGRLYLPREYLEDMDCCRQMDPQAIIADAVTKLPSVVGSTTNQNSNQGYSGGVVGIVSMNLRNLGANRTLVLLDGQRSVPAAVTGIVDVNTDRLDCRELDDPAIYAARASAWQQAAAANGGVHPAVRPVESRMLRRMRATARPALQGSGMMPD